MSDPRWPEDAVAGELPGTVILCELDYRFRFGGTFPAGWRPVAYHEHMHAWDMARVWYWPIAIIARWWSDQPQRFPMQDPQAWRAFR